jgi:hypothetical protein
MLLGLVAASAVLAPANGHKLDDFHLRGSDGRHYNLKSLTAGKPVLIFYLRSEIKALNANSRGEFTKYRLDGFQKPYRQGDLERLEQMTRGKMRICAFTAADSYADLRLQKRLTGCKFLLLGDDEKYSLLGLIMQILVGYDSRDLHHLQNALILPNGTCAAVWPGYSRASLAQMERIVLRSGIRLQLDLSKFPRQKQTGYAEMFGLPGP